MPLVTVPWVTDTENSYNDAKNEDIWYAVRDPEGWWSAVIRDNGCVDLSRYHNIPLDKEGDNPEQQLVDYIHICDLDDFIERLQALKVTAEAHWGAWPQ